MIKGKDQTFARDFNMKTILQLLQRENMSCSELADKIGLSKPAMTKITGEMYELDLIKTQSKQTSVGKELGRKRVYLTVNPDFGVVAVIDFSTVSIKICVADMHGTIIEETIIPDSEYLTPEILDNVSRALTEMLQRKSTIGKELLSLCIAASGMVDKHNQKIIVSPKFKACRDIVLSQYFSDKFNCHVEVKNDVNLSLIGEQYYSPDLELTDCIMLYIDSGVGGALLIDNKILDGKRGFAGEFGLIEVKDGDIYYPFDSVCSINAIKVEIRKRGRPDCLPERFHFVDVARAYKYDDPLVKAVVNESAVVVANVINNLSVALDCQHAIISGRVREFGSEYLNKVKASVKNCKVEFNRLDGDSIVFGSILAALKMAIDCVIARR